MSNILQELETQIADLKTAVTKSNVGTVRQIGDGVAKVEGLLDVLPLLVRQQWPVAHRSAIDHPTHPYLNQTLGRRHKSVVIWNATGITRRHQGGNTTAKNVRTHLLQIIRTQPLFGQPP